MKQELSWLQRQGDARFVILFMILLKKRKEGK